MKTLVMLGLVVACLCVSSGCATITGTVTGPVTGMIDAPAETYRHNAEAFQDNPMLFGLNAVVMAPVGIVTGPFFGFFKGLSLDIQWAIGQMDYHDVFDTYTRRSIWRPHSVEWRPVSEAELQERYNISPQP